MRLSRVGWAGLISAVGIGIAVLVTAIAGGEDEPAEAAVETSSDGPGTAGLVLIILGIIASFVFAGWLARRILRSTSRSGVLEQGVPARAVIQGMTETGTTVNQHPMVDFELEVTRPGHAPYRAAVKQILPRLLLGRVGPGTEVGVRVLPETPTEVAIDWQTLDGVADPDAEQVPEGLLAGATVGATISTKEFLAASVRAEAEIDQMSETGMTAPDRQTGEELEVFAFMLTVTPPDGLAYETKLLQALPSDLVGRVGPGAMVPIGINPDDAADVAVDWDAYRT